MSNPYKRIKSIVEHDRAEAAYERVNDAVASDVTAGNVSLFLADVDRLKAAGRWLGWAKQEMRRHGCI